MSFNYDTIYAGSWTYLREGEGFKLKFSSIVPFVATPLKWSFVIFTVAFDSFFFRLC